jgi:hypothetical protein
MAISKSLSRSLSRSLSLVAPQETADEKYAASVRQAFGSFDKDGSGSIDASELKACLNSMGVFLSAEELDGLMGRMDTDGNGVIDLNEFAAAMHEHKEVRPPLGAQRSAAACPPPPPPPCCCCAHGAPFASARRTRSWSRSWRN